MKCDDIREQLPDYWTGALDEIAKSEMQTHLASCSSCRAEADTLSVIWKKSSSLFPASQRPRSLRFTLLLPLKE